jgi:hypothetical protein
MPWEGFEPTITATVRHWARDISEPDYGDNRVSQYCYWEAQKEMFLSQVVASSASYSSILLGETLTLRDST